MVKNKFLFLRRSMELLSRKVLSPFYKIKRVNNTRLTANLTIKAVVAFKEYDEFIFS